MTTNKVTEIETNILSLQYLNYSEKIAYLGKGKKHDLIKLALKLNETVLPGSKRQI